MSDEIKNKVIVIQSVNDEGNRVVIKDQDNVSYSFFKNKQAGGQTQPYQHFYSNNHGNAFQVGDTVNLGFTTKDGEYQGKAVTYRNAISFLATTNQPQVQEKKQVQQSESHPDNNAPDWTRVGRLKSLNNLAGRRLGAGIEPTTVLKEVPIYRKINDAIEAAVDDNLIEDSEDDVNVEDIPF